MAVAEAKKATHQDVAGSELYWIGTLPSSPMEVITIAGISFPRYTSPFSRRQSLSGRTVEVRNEQYGARIALTSQKVAEIKQRASQLVLRLRGSGENLAGQLYTKVDKKDGKYIPNPKFVAQPNDKPVVDHVYMVPVSKIDSASLLDSEYLPEPISKMG